MSGLMDALNQLAEQHVKEVEAQLPSVVESIMKKTVDNTKTKYAALYVGNSPTPHQLTNSGTYSGQVMSRGLTAHGTVDPKAAPQASWFGQPTHAPFAQMYESGRILNLKASNLWMNQKVFWPSKSVQPLAQQYMVEELQRQVAAAGLRAK